MSSQPKKELCVCRVVLARVERLKEEQLKIKSLMTEIMRHMQSLAKESTRRSKFMWCALSVENFAPAC